MLSLTATQINLKRIICNGVNNHGVNNHGVNNHGVNNHGVNKHGVNIDYGAG